MKALGILLMMTLVGFGNSAAADPTLVRSGSLENGLPYTQFQYANGLQLYVIENHSAPVLSYQTWFNVGALQEKLDPKINTTGLAHLFEHLMFRGTSVYPDGAFDEILATLGATDENATTWNDRTNYYESVPSSQLETVMKLESDRLQNLNIQKNFTAEQSAVVAEFNMYQDDPTTVAYDLLYANAFTVHPYRYTTIGTEADITGFTIPQAQYFYRTYYVPNNATILIVGDVDPKLASQLVQNYYGSFSQGVFPKLTAPQEPPQTQVKSPVQFQHPQLTQTKLVIGYHTPAVTDPDFPALWVAQAMLSIGQSSIVQNIWVESGKAVSVSGSIDQFHDPGLLTLTADIQSPNQAADLLGPLDQALTSLATAPDQTAVDRAKSQLLLSVYGEWQENSSFASYLGEYIASAGDPLFSFGLIDAIQNVTAADVARVVGQRLISSNRTQVIGQPTGSSNADF